MARSVSFGEGGGKKGAAEEKIACLFDERRSAFVTALRGQQSPDLFLMICVVGS